MLFLGTRKDREKKIENNVYREKYNSAEKNNLLSIRIYKGVNLVVKSIFCQFREGQPRRQPRGQPKGPKSWPFGVSECGRFSEILIKKKVV